MLKYLGSAFILSVIVYVMWIYCFLYKNHFNSSTVGLCRTSEIFGASALVVGSLHYVQDKQFQHLSVSAEQWLPLVEVNGNCLAAQKYAVAFSVSDA